MGGGCFARRTFITGYWPFLNIPSLQHDPLLVQRIPSYHLGQYRCLSLGMHAKCIHSPHQIFWKIDQQSFILCFLNRMHLSNELPSECCQVLSEVFIFINKFINSSPAFFELVSALVSKDADNLRVTLTVERARHFTLVIVFFDSSLLKFWNTNKFLKCEIFK